MRKYLFVISLFVFSTIVTAETNPPIPILEIPGANWTDEEADFLIELHKKGSISIATKISSAVYMPQDDGTIRGFHYNVLKNFADLTNIEIEIKLVTWNDYFYKEKHDLERVKSEASYSYVPTLIENVDLYIDGITVLPWREKMFDIIRFVPSRQMIVSRQDNILEEINDLDNKICAMVKDTSMEFNLERMKLKNNIAFTYNYTEDFDSMDKFVSEGKADFTVYDSDRAFSALQNYNNLTITMPVSEIEIMGWAINKKNGILKSIIKKYFHYAQENAILDELWKEEYGVTFIDYLRILELK